MLVGMHYMYRLNAAITVKLVMCGLNILNVHITATAVISNILIKQVTL